jgi:hypothetical protein
MVRPDVVPHGLPTLHPGTVPVSRGGGAVVVVVLVELVESFAAPADEVGAGPVEAPLVSMVDVADAPPSGVPPISSPR